MLLIARQRLRSSRVQGQARLFPTVHPIAIPVQSFVAQRMGAPGGVPAEPAVRPAVEHDWMPEIALAGAGQVLAEVARTFGLQFSIAGVLLTHAAAHS